MSIWLVGAGLMAQDYAKVLSEIGKPFDVIGRGENSAKIFEQMTGNSVRKGGLQLALNNEKAPDQAIIAVGVEELSSTATELILGGTKRILIEKPGGLNLQEISNLNQLSKNYNSTVLIAYNRRFYSSVEEAKKYIAKDGGLLSAKFEFTEWAHEIAPLQKANGVKERWLLGNSSHVIDLVFHLIGRPTDWHAWCAGSIDWHPASARFCGAGITDRNVMFSYHADWQAPGRWGIELLTSFTRLTLCPMENLKITKLGSVLAEDIKIDNELDLKFKPGLFKQTLNFIEGRNDLFCSLEDQLFNTNLYYKIGGYKD